MRDGKIRTALVHTGWKISKVISTAEGLAIIAKGTCPGCGKAWSKKHRECVPGLFPGSEKDE